MLVASWCCWEEVEAFWRCQGGGRRKQGRGVAGLGPRGADRKAGAVFQCWSPSPACNRALARGNAVPKDGRRASVLNNRPHSLHHGLCSRRRLGAHYTRLKEVEAGATVRAHTQQNPPGCHEGVGSNGPIGLPPYEVLRLGSPANTGGPRGARAGPSSLRVTNGKGKGQIQIQPCYFQRELPQRRADTDLLARSAEHEPSRQSQLASWANQ